MKKIIWLLLVCIFIFEAVSAQNIEEYYFKFTITSKSELEKITQIISIDNVKENIVFAYANKDELNEFQKLGYKIEFIQKDVPKLLTMATTVAEMANWDRYPTYEVYQQMMRKFEKDHPSICKLDSFGTSINGRQLYVVKISDNVTNDEAEPEFFYTSTIHGNETTGYILMLRLIDSLLTSYGTSTDLTNLINSTEIFINPNSNPDGTYRGGNNTVSGATRSNANNVDLNRDFPDPRIGLNSPYQKENIAMMNYVNTHNFVMSANFHGGTEVMNFPWDTWTSSQNKHPDDNWFKSVCSDYVATTRTVLSTYMTSEYSSGITEGGDWYVITGGRQDYMNFWRKCREVTIELSNAYVLGTEYLNNYWNYNRIALINYIKECNYGIKGYVKDYENNPLKAMIFVNDYDQLSDSSFVYSNSTHGDFYRLLNPGTYSLTASKYGYISQTIDNVTFGENSSVNVNFVLEKDIQYEVTGQVINGISGNPVPGVIVSILNAPIVSDTANSLGQYNLNNITAGTYYIKLIKDKLTTTVDTIIIDADHLTHNFTVYPALIEDFETGDFNKLNWQFSGNANWTIDSTVKSEGLYSAKSGIIENSSSSIISIEINILQAGYLSFNRKVSSENGYDFLKFYIDDVLKNQWSGSLDWEEFSYYVNTGIHTFKWIYSKDGNTASGSDCAWIDYVSFPYTNFNDTSLTITPLEITDTLANNDSVVHTLIIENSGTSGNSYEAIIVNDPENEWLSINKTNDSIVFDSRDTLYVTLKNLNLSPGIYTNQIAITEFDNDQYFIPVSILVPDTSLIVNPSHIIDTLNFLDSVKYELVIQNTGSFLNSYNLTIENESLNTWLSADKKNGAINKLSSDTIILTLKNEYLEAGNYYTTITITESDNDTYIIPVDLFVPVSPDTSLVISPQSLGDTLIPGESAVHKLILYNSGTNRNIYNILTLTADCNWFSTNKIIDTIDIHSFDTLLVTIRNESLPTGNYNCILYIMEEDGDTYPIPIHLNVPVIGNSRELSEINEIQVYPNPFNSTITFGFPEQIIGDIIIQLFSTTGKLILQKNVGFTIDDKHYFTIDGLNYLKSGVYFVKITTNAKSYSVRIVK